jgi:hypothetical protein
VFSGGTCSGGHGLSIGSVGGRSDNTVNGVTFSNSVVKASVNGKQAKATNTQIKHELTAGTHRYSHQGL